MAIYTIDIDEKSDEGKAFIAFLKTLKIVSVKSVENTIEESTLVKTRISRRKNDPNLETQESIKDAELKKVKTYASFDDFKARMYEI